MTEQELGLHLIARYLLTPDKFLPNVDHMIDKLRGIYGLGRIDNLSISSCGAFICWERTVCINCRQISSHKMATISRVGCNNCMVGNSIINYHIMGKSQQINSDVALIPYEYKLKLQEILWQTYLRRLL